MIATRIRIEQADAMHAGELADLRVASLIEMKLLRAPQGPALRRTARVELVQALREERCAAWILRDGPRAVGSACVMFFQRLPYPEGSLHAEIGGVYVAPEFRGRGYASEMVKEAIAWAKARRVRKISLHASDSGRAMYERLGFSAGSEMRLSG